jgi:hypothetical protein
MARKIPNLFWWLGAGTLLLWYTKRAEAQEKLGNLVIRIQMKTGPTGEAVDALINSILAVRGTLCPTFPDVKTKPGGATMSGSTIVAVFVASWKHDILGPIKEEARVCLLNYLKGIDKNVLNVSAERVS